MRSKISVPLLTFTLFAHIFFWGYNLLTGRIYARAAADNSFILFMMVADIIPLFYFVRYLTDASASRRHVGGLMIAMAVILFVLMIEGDIDYPLVKSFIAYSIPAALTGILIAKYRSGEQFAKYLDLFMLILTFIGIISMRAILAVSYQEVAEDFGIGVQSLSYYCFLAESVFPAVW